MSELTETLFDTTGILFDGQDHAGAESDQAPSDVTDGQGKREILVPDLVSMTKVLFARYRLAMYSYLNRCLRDGTIACLAGDRILDRIINRDVVNFTHVDYWRIDREDFYADVSVELKLRVPYGVRHWKGYLVCWCDFSQPDTYTVTIEELTDRVSRPSDEYDRLSKYLVPYATGRRVDEISEGIWKEYCEEALDDPTKRVAETLARKMGLNVVHHAVYEHRDVDSIIFFKEDCLFLGEDRYENDAAGKKKHVKAASGEPVVIPANTIVVNSNLIRREYSAFNIFHECYHFREHYLFYRLQELKSNDSREVPFRRETVSRDSDFKDPVYFMENQADRGAMGLMMPASHMRRMILEECGKVKGFQHAGEMYETAGMAIKQQLHLPEFRIRMRMVQLGHVGAKGALNYVQKEKMEPFAFAPGTWNDSSHTFIIDRAKVTALERKNGDFRKLIESGEYVYADGHIVRNLPEYVRWDTERERYLLTDDAKKRADRCCLRFIRKYVQKNVGRYVYGRMYYDPDYVARCEFYLGDIINGKQMNLPDAQYEYEKNFPAEFKDALFMLMRKNGDTQETMAEKLQTSDRRLREWLKDPARFFTVDRVIKLCLMWKLPDFISRLLLESLDFRLNRRDPRNRALIYILEVMWDRGVDEANAYLKENHFDTLAA